mgnify:CR=1 FL=1
MPEPVSFQITVISWLAKKGAEVAWQQIYPFFQPDRLKKEIESALKSDPDVIQPHPTLYKDRLNSEAASELLQTAVTKDSTALAKYLLDEQLISLPMNPEEKPDSYNAVWTCIAKTVIEAVGVAIIKDDKLFRQFSVIIQQHSHLEQQQIITEVQSIHANLDKLGEQFQRIEEFNSQATESTQATVISEPAVARSFNLLSEQNEQLEQQLRDELDEKTEKQWDLILNEIQRHNFWEAITKGQELAGWLDVKENQLSNAVRGRAFLLLAQVALIESSEWGELQNDFTKSRELFQKACAEFGDDVTDENKLRLSSFEAKLLSIDGHADKALSLLGTATDPQSISTRLLILIDGGESGKGVEIIRNLPINEKWCEQAAYVYARSREGSLAQDALDWAGEHGDAALEHRCRIAIARATLTRLMESHDDSAFSILSITDDAAKDVKQVLACIAPIVDECHVRNDVKTGIEADAVGFAYSCYCLVGPFDKAQSNAELLRDHRPVHLEYANAVIRGDVEFDADTADRLRDDYANYFVARDMALSIDIQAGIEPNDVLARADELAKLANTLSEREKLARMVVQTATTPGHDVNDRARTITEQLVGSEHFLFRLLEAHRWFRDGNLEKYEQTLDTLEGEKDYLLDQFRAQLLIKRGKYTEAAETLESAGRYLSEPDLLKDAAGLALGAKSRRLDIAMRSLEAALVICPKDKKINLMLADVYIQLQGFASAAECFDRLRKIEPDETRHALNHAICCAKANQPIIALEIYDKLCGQPNAPINAHLGRALLLADIGKPAIAFSKLQDIRSQHWDEPAFVGNYMSLAYAANQDKLAHEGFQQLWDLRESGKIPPEFLQPKSLDDFIQFREDAQERRNFLLDQSLAGKMPWLFFENLLGNVPYWGWRIRTQPMSWFFDDARNRASFSIYSTNSYAVLLEDDRKSLKRVTCSRQGEPVVADLSALITLHRLDLLDKAIEYFGQTKIPPSYLAGTLQQSGRLQPHQLSQKTNLEYIKVAIDTRKIHIVVNADGLAVIDEYREDDEPACYRIQDLLRVLKKVGRISQTQMHEALHFAKKPVAASEKGQELNFGDYIAVSLLTLQTIADMGLFDVVCDAFDRVIISESDYERMVQDLRGFELTAETQTWHENLWGILSDDERVDASAFVMYPWDEANESEADENDESEFERVAALDAALLAEQQHLSLLVDDRVCQNMALVSNPCDSSAAFSTDCLLEGLREAGMIDSTRAARAYLQLIEWRYRFLIIPISILHTIAKDFPEHDLRKVAKYLHDCMRDPGLFGAPEQTDPPLPIAFRYYQDWLKVIATFVAETWLDESVSEDRASELTYWAMTEFVPTLPTVLGERIGRVANISAFTVLHHAMIRMCETPDNQRANTALRIMAHGLGLDNEEFIHIAADIINHHD